MCLSVLSSTDESELSEDEKVRRREARKILREQPPMSPGGGRKTKRRFRKTFRFKMPKKDVNGRVEWVWQHVRNTYARDAALKAATRGMFCGIFVLWGRV